MRVSAKLEYACRAMIELSLHWPSKVPLQIGKIAQRQNIPLRFLTHILISLKQLGLVESIRGKAGGYILAKAPQDIYLSDIMMGFGGLELSQNSVNADDTCQVLDNIWRDVDDLVLKSLSTLSLKNLGERVRQNNKTLIYEI